MAGGLDIALVQTRTPATASAGLAHLEPLIRKACAGGARLILTPEGSNLLEQRKGLRDQALSPEEEDPAVVGLRRLAAELEVWLLIGSAIVRSDRPGDTRAVNRSLLVDPAGTITARYDKMHVFDVDLPNGERYRESAVVRPGEAATAAQTPWGRLGLTICYDVRFPYLHRDLAKAGATMIACPAAFTVATGQAHWETLLRARAIENGAFVLAPAQGGAHEDGRKTFGRSLVVDPWGEVIAKADHDEPCVLHAKLDMEAIAKARAAIPSLSHDRSFTSAR